MLSPAFFRRLKQLRQQRQRATEYQQYLTTLPAAGTGDSQGGTWKGKVAQTIVYGPEGKAYPNPAAAMSAGASNFTYNLPSGVNVDWSYWNKFTQPPTTTPVPVPITVAPQNTVVPGVNTNAPDADQNTNPPTEGPTEGPVEGPTTTPPIQGPTTTPPTQPPTKDPFADVSAGRLAEAKRYADAGMMGRAKQQFELGGGTWDESKMASKALRTEAKATDRYGGDFKFSKSGVESKDINKALRKFKSSGSMASARKAIEDAGGTWSKALHKRLRAEAERKKKKK